jgi:hypothetical protein
MRSPLSTVRARLSGGGKIIAPSAEGILVNRSTSLL